MSGSNAVQPRELQHLIDEVWLLHVRLHRITVALALTEELLAETFERMAEDRTEGSSLYRVQAQRARVSAEECRTFAARVDTLGPKPSAIDLTVQPKDRTVY